MATKKKKGFHKSIKIYFSKLKSMQSSLSHLSATTTSSSGSLFTACKYPKTPSFVENRNVGGGNAATLSDVDRFLHENFHSLYPPPSPILDVGRRPTSRAESPPANSNLGSAEVPGGGVALTTLSKNPYEDFRRSMQEMMDARHVEPLQPLDWDFMEELLFCYIELNNRNVHKYILQAFTDLTVRFRVRDEERSRWMPARRRRMLRGVSVAGRVRGDDSDVNGEEDD